MFGSRANISSRYSKLANFTAYYSTTLNTSNSTTAKPPNPSLSSQWTPKTARIGAVAFKRGMMSYWDKWGCRHPVTVLELQHTQVLSSNSDSGLDKLNLVNVEVGVGSKPLKNCKNLKYYSRLKIFPKQAIRTFRVPRQSVLPTGTPILAAHFVPGQCVDVQGTSIGKGFQGVMKRHNFSGMPASHGVSLTHRSGGSIKSLPTVVRKGTKMAGHMGNEKVTVKGLKVLKIDTKYNCLFVKGAVPGCDGSVIRIKDAQFDNFFNLSNPPPFPTFVKDPSNPLPQEICAPDTKEDPLIKRFGNEK